ncbi:NAD(P)H-dependent flavin oxidoreductase [Chloroflexota bacterium]
MLHTWITEKIGIRYPIIQGAMHWLAGAKLAAAVSNAGGLGMITAMNYESPDKFKKEIRKARKLTDKPFAVNISLEPTRRRVLHEEYLATAIEEGVRIIETSSRSPEPYCEWLCQSGVIHLHKVSRIRDAHTAARLGVAAITIVGYEGGGHIGNDDVTSLIKIQQAVAALDIPIIAAGGFTSGAGLVAALALGAQGVMIGTRFLLCQECPLHPKIKTLLSHTLENRTVIIERSINNDARVLDNYLARKILKMEAEGATIEKLFPYITGTRTGEAYRTGETENAIIYCGEAIGLVNQEQNAAEIISEIIAEAGAVALRLRNIGLLPD